MGAETTFRFNPLGDLLVQTDARGNCQRFHQTVDGQLRDTSLQLKNAVVPEVLVHHIHYNAQGQIEQQTSGNGVISRWEYCAKDGRLKRLEARRADGEFLQDLNYSYDPVGNILSIDDQALPARFFANQRIEPVNRYVYDSLYQLIEARGWEAGSANRGPDHLEDPKAVANYRQTYHYDASGNLLHFAFVQDKHAKSGAYTDSVGNFSLLTSQNAMLAINCAGYKDTLVKAGDGKDGLNIVLRPDGINQNGVGESANKLVQSSATPSAYWQAKLCR